MPFVHRARRAAALLAIVAVGACSDSTAPTIDNIDALAASAKLEPVLGVMQQGAMNSFASLGEAGGLPASASSAALSAVAHLTTTAARGRPDASAPRLARAVAQSAADVIPPEARGMLFTYNETTGEYEGAPSAEAPSNGIRIILYAVDPLTWQITSPLTPIGHVNLLDESTSQQNRLHVELVSNQGNTELMDYAITHSVTASSESFSIVGTARNISGTSVNFDLSGTASETAATATFSLTAPSVGFSVSESVNANMVTGQATVSVELGYDGHTLSFTITVSETSISGEIRYDDKRYATMSVTFDPQTGEVTSSSFVKANGRPITVEELDAISSIFDGALNFDDFWAGLLWPVGALAPTV
jgi:hypothetical protein